MDRRVEHRSDRVPAPPAGVGVDQAPPGPGQRKVPGTMSAYTLGVHPGAQSDRGPALAHAQVDPVAAHRIVAPHRETGATQLRGEVGSPPVVRFSLLALR